MNFIDRITKLSITTITRMSFVPIISRVGNKIMLAFAGSSKIPKRVFTEKLRYSVMTRNELTNSSVIFSF